MQKKRKSDVFNSYKQEFHCVLMTSKSTSYWGQKFSNMSDEATKLRITLQSDEATKLRITLQSALGNNPDND